MPPTPFDHALALKARGRFRSARLVLERMEPTARDGSRVHHLTATAEVLQRTGDGAAAARAARRVLRSSNAPPDCRARCHAVLGVVAAEHGEPARSLNRFRRAVEAAQAADDPELAGRIRLDIAGELMDVVGVTVTARLIDECARSATIAAHPHLHLRFHLACASIDTRQGRLELARSHLRVAEELLATGENLWLAGLLALARADACALGADHAAAARHCRAARAHATRSGHLAARVGAMVRLARAKLAVGSVRDSEILCDETLALSGGTTRIRVALLDTLARIGLHRARPDVCRQRLEELDDVVRGQASFPPSSEVLSSFLTRARLALAGSAWHEALAICENGIAKADECGDLPRGLSLRCLKADACRRLDRLDMAARALAEAREKADGAPLPLLAELQRAHASLLEAAAPGRRTRPAVESSLRVLSVTGAADARRDGLLGYLQTTSGIGPGLRSRLTAKPWDLSPIIRGTLPGRTSRPIPGRRAATIPDLLDLAPLAHLVSQPALLAQEVFVLLRRSGCARALAIVFTRDGHSFELRAHEGWSATAAVAAARRPGRVTISCGRGAEGELRVIVAPPDDVRALAGLHALRSHIDRLVALETFRHAEPRRPAPWPPELPVPGEAGVFASPAMRRLVETARKVAASTLPILLVGESGTGKEVLARLIHRHSERSRREFVPYNCTGAPRDMIDSQLFGHCRGSFTGAYENVPGLVRTADGGTLLLDEVSELDLQTQPKLLRLLENNEVQPVGAARPVTVDVRVIAATNSDPAELVQHGRFRKDLFFRLNAVRLAVPPLRERRDDIPPLVHYFLRRHGAEHGRPHLKLADRTLKCFLRYEWPGNVRQLSNEIRRAAALADDRTTISPEHLSAEVHGLAAEPAAADPAALQVTLNPDQTLAAATARVERTLIRRALEATGGRVDDAAQRLGLSRKGFFLKRRRLGIDVSVA
ncbi:MAG: sigma-54-dependent Fis family transcriptional regulator [Acidobacteria bacterium]|nr:sigma-54-dependent Fis family transcriptional regulator [Acidobacteriota bacterium]